MSKYNFKQGFGQLRKILSEKGRYVADCNSCKFFYKDNEGEEEYCHNSNVTKFDMQNVGERIFCTFWSVLDKKEDY